jgi:hypothetical protein
MFCQTLAFFLKTIVTIFYVQKFESRPSIFYPIYLRKYFCGAMLNQRMHPSTPLPKFGNKCKNLRASKGAWACLCFLFYFLFYIFQASLKHRENVCSCYNRNVGPKSPQNELFVHICRLTFFARVLADVAFEKTFPIKNQWIPNLMHIICRAHLCT